LGFNKGEYNMSSFSDATKSIVQNYRIPEESKPDAGSMGKGFMASRNKTPEPTKLDTVAQIMRNIRKEREKLKNG
tara:strand:+ start:843 stop:1067 length:225 start_codon:yes stop_codon:yes gene_type:complete